MATWIAVVLLVLWPASALAVKAVLTRRWPMITFVALDWRRWTARDWAAAGLATVAVVPLVGGIALAAAGSRIDPHLTPPWYWAPVGAGIVASSIAATVWSQLAMGSSWRIGVNPGETPTLVTAGPFRWVRNPIYTSMIATAIGLTVLLPTVGTMVGTLVLWAFVEWQVRAVEEPFLLRGHGRAYLSWSAGTGRFLPNIGYLAQNPAR